MEKDVPPSSTTVLVIGGGPGGSYASSILAREGIDVVLLEAAKFPRYHIGESMLPSMRHFLRFIGFEEGFRNHGFIYKGCAFFKLNSELRESYVNFMLLGPKRTTWNVIRSEADELLLRHAAEEGAHVFEETRVTSLQFEGKSEASRPISATWAKKDGQSGTITFDWLIDASGRNGIMSTKYLKNRVVFEELRNNAVWGYWKRTKLIDEGAPWFEAMADGSGWGWFIPLHDDTTSIGIVMNQNASAAKKRNHEGVSPSLTDHYLDQLKLMPGLLDLIDGTRDFIPGSVMSCSDSSYFSTQYAGDHFRLIGDAACFIDPLFSSGVHLAFTSALSAASTICASIKGQASEQEAQRWHNAKVSLGYSRFLLVVLCAYKQIQRPREPILAKPDENSCDKSFAKLRQVIQGVVDTELDLSREELDGISEFYGSLLKTSESNCNSAQADFSEHGDLTSSESSDKKDGVFPVLQSLLGETSWLDGLFTLNKFRINMERGNLGLIKY